MEEIFRLKYCVALCLAFVIGLTPCSSLAISEGEDAPGFSLPTNQGKIVSLKDYHGKTTLVDFWASWCAACAKSLSWLEELQAKFGPSGFQVIALNLDEDRADADQALEGAGVKHLLVAYDPEGRVPQKYKVEVMPSSYLIDTSGKVVAEFRGSKESEKERLEEHLHSIYSKRGDS